METSLRWNTYLIYTRLYIPVYPPVSKESKKSTFLAVPTQRQQQTHQQQAAGAYRQAAPRQTSTEMYGIGYGSGSESEFSEVAVVHDQSYNPAYYNELKWVDKPNSFI